MGTARSIGLATPGADQGMLVPDVRVATDAEFVPAGEFTATQIRAALAADGITWEAS